MPDKMKEGGSECSEEHHASESVDAMMPPVEDVVDLLMARPLAPQ